MTVFELEIFNPLFLLDYNPQPLDSPYVASKPEYRTDLFRHRDEFSILIFKLRLKRGLLAKIIVYILR